MDWRTSLAGWRSARVAPICQEQRPSRWQVQSSNRTGPVFAGAGSVRTATGVTWYPAAIQAGARPPRWSYPQGSRAQPELDISREAARGRHQAPGGCRVVPRLRADRRRDDRARAGHRFRDRPPLFLASGAAAPDFAAAMRRPARAIPDVGRLCTASFPPIRSRRRLPPCAPERKRWPERRPRHRARKAGRGGRPSALGDRGASRVHRMRPRPCGSQIARAGPRR